MAPQVRVWCCRRCGAPLGQIDQKKRLVVHEPHASFYIPGVVLAACRCTQRNVLAGDRRASR